LALWAGVWQERVQANSALGYGCVGSGKQRARCKRHRRRHAATSSKLSVSLERAGVNAAAKSRRSVGRQADADDIRGGICTSLFQAEAGTIRRGIPTSPRQANAGTIRRGIRTSIASLTLQTVCAQ
jgi:hypothetical protein